MNGTELKTNLLRNWSIDHHWDGNMVLHGEIYNDDKGRFPDGATIRTSRLLYIDFVEGIAKTKNSVYHLEKRSRK